MSWYILTFSETLILFRDWLQSLGSHISLKGTVPQKSPKELCEILDTELLFKV